MLKQTSFSESSFHYPLDIDFAFTAKPQDEKPADVNPINQVSINYIHSPVHLCQSSSSFNALILVKSGLDNYEHRSVIRQTWFTELARNNMRAAFILGTTMNESQAQLVDQEATLHRDIIQYDLIDSYYNNTYKAMAALRWQKQMCSNNRFKYLVMMDDDYYVNVPKLRHYVESNQNEGDFVAGYLYTSSQPKRIPGLKWFTSLEEYEYSRWPVYPSGGFYILSKYTADRISRAFPYVKYSRYDDALIGIILLKLKIISTQEGNLFMLTPPLFVSSYLDIVSAHTISNPQLIYKVWHSLHPAE
ncbi:hypothetical protein Ciccas_008864 [Cichlidogyrus casuarinus]|uniref:Hexosyltransferase n=1 Tax=Cichlidogyrus casuarinus TaxID=1844966 RepID=A0ABD2PZL1_9PLAT